MEKKPGSPTPYFCHWQDYGCQEIATWWPQAGQKQSQACGVDCTGGGYPMMEKLFLIMFALVIVYFASADIMWVDHAVHVGGP